MMQRNRRRGQYASGGSGFFFGQTDGFSKKKKKKKWSERIRVLLVLLVFAALIGIVIAYALYNTGREGMGRVMRIGATLSQNVMPFGDTVIFYDGTTLHCVASTGGNEWSYQIGANADYDASDERIVAWSGNDLYILNRRGRLIYNNTMTDMVQFASVGDEYVAVFIGQPDSGVVTVINELGQVVDNITVENQTLLDIGFFTTQTTSKGQQVELMWMLGLDTTGTVISTRLETYQPGRYSTGSRSLGEHIAYLVYFADGLLNVVDTRQITHYDYRVIKQGSDTLIYGYTMQEHKQIGTTMVQLLIPVQEINSGISINNIRLMTGNVDRVLHLPDTCIAAVLGSRCVYAFSPNAVYVCRYGETTFRAHAMSVSVTGVLGMLEGDRAVIASGSEIYVVELPQ